MYSAALYSKADLVFNGTGTLNVNAGYRNGIKSNDDLKIVSGEFNVTSTEDGIIGKYPVSKWWNAGRSRWYGTRLKKIDDVWNLIQKNKIVSSKNA